MMRLNNKITVPSVLVATTALGVVCYFNSSAAVYLSTALRLTAFIIAFVVLIRRWNWPLFILSLLLPFSSFFILYDFFKNDSTYEMFYFKEHIRQAVTYTVSVFIFFGTVYVRKFYQKALKMSYLEKKLNEKLKTFETIFNIIPELIFIIDKDGYFRDVIANNEEELYIPKEEIIGKNLKGTLPDYVVSKSLQAIKETLKTGEKKIIEYNLDMKSGKKYFSANHAPFLDDRVLVTVKNITDYVEVNKSLAESEEKYKYLIKESADGIMRFEIDRPMSIKCPVEEQLQIFFNQARLAECNDAYAKMYGYDSATEVIGKKLENFLRMDASESEKFLINFVTSGYKLRDVVTIENDINGKKRIFSNNLFGYVVDGMISHAWGIQRDITIEANLEEISKKEKELMGKILSSLEIGLTIYNRNMEVLWVNEFIKKMFPFGDPVGKKCYVHFVKKDTVCEKCSVAKTFETQKNQNEMRFSKVINKWYNSRTFIIYDENQKDFQVLESIVDVTDQIKSEENKTRIEQQMLQSQKLESLGVLAGGIAHDFNNLLMGILGNADLLLSKLKGSSTEISYVSEIIQASKNASQLTKQLLSYSGKGTLELEEVDLNGMIREMAPILLLSISKKATIKYDLTEDIPCVSGDLSQIRQIIMNLIINASESLNGKHGLILVRTNVSRGTHASDEEGIVGNLDQDVNYVYIEVTDSGTGMDEETKSKIFEPFYSTKFIGRGLGLAAVLGIVKAHRGAIKVVSEPGQGSTFRIFLPSGGRIKEKKSDNVEMKTLEKGRGTILLIDDEKLVRDICVKMLDSLGFKVLTARDGIEGIEVFISEKDAVDCIILDLTMPRMDGEECLSRIREIKPDAKVIMSSGYDEHDISKKFMGREINGFIQKPYNLKTLSKTLSDIFEARKS